MQRLRDYQDFYIQDGSVLFDGEGGTLKRKLAAVESFIPDMVGKDVLDIGCESGYFSFAAKLGWGARRVLGLDRGREGISMVRSNIDYADECGVGDQVEFFETNIGEDFPRVGKFDMAFMFSMYHHIFAQVGCHTTIFQWIANALLPGGHLIFEGPVDFTDPVARQHIPHHFADGWTRERILAGADQAGFILEGTGPGHNETRSTFLFKRAKHGRLMAWAKIQGGAGGASKCFTFFRNGASRRMDEIDERLGFLPYPGSLNMRLGMPLPNQDWKTTPWAPVPFNWREGKTATVDIFDVKDRRVPLSHDLKQWYPRTCMFAPVLLEQENGTNRDWGYAMRFANEKYPAEFIEVISPHRLRDRLTDEEPVVVSLLEC